LARTHFEQVLVRQFVNVSARLVCALEEAQQLVGFPGG
jgi:hypothetical protein